MTTTRRTFLTTSALCVGALFFPACRGEDPGAPLPVTSTPSPERGEPLPKTSPPPDAEISGVLAVPREEAEAGQPRTYAITGDGHTHEVPVDLEDLSKLLSEGATVVRSGPGGDNGHAHWIRVTLS